MIVLMRPHYSVSACHHVPGTVPGTFHSYPFTPHQEGTATALPLQVRNSGLERPSNAPAQAHAAHVWCGGGQFCTQGCLVPKLRFLATALGPLLQPGLLLETPLTEEERPGGASSCRGPAEEREPWAHSPVARTALGLAHTWLSHFLNRYARCAV